MAEGKDWHELMDHPLVFLIVMTIGVMAMSSLFTWGAKSAGWNGVATLSQHP